MTVRRKLLAMLCELVALTTLVLSVWYGEIENKHYELSMLVILNSTLILWIATFFALGYVLYHHPDSKSLWWLLPLLLGLVSMIGSVEILTVDCQHYQNCLPTSLVLPNLLFAYSCLFFLVAFIALGYIVYDSCRYRHSPPPSHFALLTEP